MEYIEGIDRARILGHRHALAGQRRLVGMEVCLFDEAAVRRNLVAGLDEHDISRDDLMGSDALTFAIAHHG